MIKVSRKKPAKTSAPPKELTTTWLSDDFYESTTKPYSYAKEFTRYYVYCNKTGRELYCFKKREDAEKQVELIDDTWLVAFEPTEEQAHEMRLAELANLRWEGGYGA